MTFLNVLWKSSNVTLSLPELSWCSKLLLPFKIDEDALSLISMTFWSVTLLGYVFSLSVMSLLDNGNDDSKLTTAGQETSSRFCHKTYRMLLKFSSDDFLCSFAGKRVKNCTFSSSWFPSVVDLLLTSLLLLLHTTFSLKILDVILENTTFLLNELHWLFSQQISSTTSQWHLLHKMALFVDDEAPPSIESECRFLLLPFLLSFLIKLFLLHVHLLTAFCDILLEHWYSETSFGRCCSCSSWGWVSVCWRFSLEAKC